MVRGTRSNREAPSNVEPMSMEIEKLRHALLRALSSTVADTVETVCEEYEESFNAVTPKNNRHKGGQDTDYDMYYNCCRRLVTYISENMVTSPDFIQQMDRIILACHSNASERVLRSVVAKSLWFHRKEANVEDTEEEEEDDEVEVRASHRQKRQTRRASKAAFSSGTKRRTPPSPVSIPSKRQKPVNTRATGRRSTVAYNETTTDDDEEEVENYNRRNIKEDSTSEASDEESIPNNQPHYDQSDELLSFKDAIGDMCYVDRRTPAQTRFFKDRLRKAIQFVDAQLCKPPKGQQCAWDCKKIRKQMCSLNLPCRNKICRLWHDVEAHTDRCHNTHCEFRIRVMLRETMYKMDHKQLEIDSIRQEIEQKKKEKAALKHSQDRDQILDRRVIESELGQFQQDKEIAEKEYLVLKATKKAYWTTLKEIGITPQDDIKDKFPPYDAHYIVKKTPIKKKPVTPTKKTSSPLATARANRVRRRASIVEEDQVVSPKVFSPPRQRITRRSTQQSLKTMVSGVIELDDDDDEEDETKSAEIATESNHPDEDNKDDSTAPIPNVLARIMNASDIVGTSAMEDTVATVENVEGQPSSVVVDDSSTSSADNAGASVEQAATLAASSSVIVDSSTPSADNPGATVEPATSSSVVVDSSTLYADYVVEEATPREIGILGQVELSGVATSDGTKGRESVNLPETTIQQ